MKRRDFLLKAGIGALALSATPQAFGKKTSRPKKAKTLKGELLVFGTEGHELVKNSPDHMVSIFSTIDLGSGKIRQTPLVMAGAHSSWKLTDTTYLAISAHSRLSNVIDKDHKLLAQIWAPKGYYFGGHALVMPDKKLVAIAIKKDVTHSLEDKGFLHFYDLETIQFKKSIPLSSTFPHDVIRWTQNQIAVSSYGTVRFDLRGDDVPIVKDGLTVGFNVQNPLIDFISLDSLSVASTLHHPSFYGLNHITKPSESNLYSVSVQSLKRDETSRKWLLEKFGNDNLMSIPSLEDDRFFSLPSPIRKMTDRESLPENDIIADPLLQLRSQDIDSDSKTGAVFCSFTVSNSVGILLPERKLDLIELSAFGIKKARGVAHIEGTEYIAVAGDRNNVVVFNYVSKEIYRIFELQTYKSLHLSFASS